MSNGVVVDLGEKLARVPEFWSPRIVGEINDMYVKVATATSAPASSSSCRAAPSTARSR